LQFLSAPDKRCILKNVFVLPGDSVDAYMDYKGFTLVHYVNLRTDQSAIGWVESSRLKANGQGIAPRQ
jgi:hypothetical protein